MLSHGFHNLHPGTRRSCTRGGEGERSGEGDRGERGDRPRGDLPRGDMERPEGGEQSPGFEEFLS